MLLIPNSSNFKVILDWIINYPDAALLFFELLSAFFTVFGAILGWLFHGIKYKRNKRLEAQTTVYPAIRRASERLEEALNNHDRLYISIPYDRDNDKGNIYSLYYIKSIRHSYSKSYHEIGNDELQNYKTLAQDLKDELKSHDNCIHPKSFQRKKWDKCIETLLDFCDFLIKIDNGYVGEFGMLNKSEKELPKHVESCCNLVKAFDYVRKNT